MPRLRTEDCDCVAASREMVSGGMFKLAAEVRANHKADREHVWRDSHAQFFVRNHVTVVAEGRWP